MHTISECLDLLDADYEAEERVTLKDLRYGRAHIDEHIGAMPPADVGAADVLKYKAARRAEGAARATVNHELCWLRRALKIVLDLGWIDNVPPIQTFPIGNTNARQDFINPGEFRRVIRELARHPDLADFFEFLYFSGWRIGEARQIDWCYVDMEEIRLPAGRTKEGKSSRRGRTRILPLIGRLATVIERRKARRDPLVSLVFHRRGRPIGDFRKAWRNALRRAGIPYVVPHALRRSFVRNAIDAGIDRDIVKQFTGHLTDCTFSRYNICDRGRLVNAARRLADVYGGGPARDGSSRLQPPQRPIVSLVDPGPTDRPRSHRAM